MQLDTPQPAHTLIYTPPFDGFHTGFFIAQFNDPLLFLLWQPSVDDFTTAKQANPDIGQLVVQLGTIATPREHSATGTAPVGFERIVRALRDHIHIAVEYAPTSVTVRSQGATVSPAISIGILGNYGWVAHERIPLKPGATPGIIQLSAPVEVGAGYLFLVFADVTVSYQNCAQGYGEVIVRIPRVTLTL